MSTLQPRIQLVLHSLDYRREFLARGFSMAEHKLESTMVHLSKSVHLSLHRRILEWRTGFGVETVSRREMIKIIIVVIILL